MKLSDLRPGTEVYHSIYTHFGKGIVHKTVRTNIFESMFERGSKRVIVQFIGNAGTSRMKASELRKTPNRKKIREMVTIYKGRGVNATDGGDRLLLPINAVDSRRAGR